MSNSPFNLEVEKKLQSIERRADVLLAVDGALVLTFASITLLGLADTVTGGQASEKLAAMDFFPLLNKTINFLRGIPPEVRVSAGAFAASVTTAIGLGIISMANRMKNRVEVPPPTR